MPDSLISRTLSFDPAEMAERGRRGGQATHRHHDSRRLAAHAREAFEARFVREVDPLGDLDAAERERCVAELRRAHFARLGRMSAAARRARRGVAA